MAVNFPGFNSPNPYQQPSAANQTQQNAATSAVFARLMNAKSPQEAMSLSLVLSQMIRNLGQGAIAEPGLPTTTAEVQAVKLTQTYGVAKQVAGGLKFGELSILAANEVQADPRAKADSPQAKQKIPNSKQAMIANLNVWAQKGQISTQRYLAIANMINDPRYSLQSLKNAFFVMSMNAQQQQAQQNIFSYMSKSYGTEDEGAKAAREAADKAQQAYYDNLSGKNS